MRQNLGPKEIRAALQDILPRVQKPSRYLGIERNLRQKPWDSVALHVALAFPDTYEIGMSHYGSQILYHLINRRPDALAERTYAPWPDLAAALSERDLPLFTLESCRGLADFEIVAISVQSELNYSNIPYLLGLAGISVRAGERGESEPLVIGGGPCMANPEPIADFFDALLIGDAEAGLDGLLDTLADARSEGTSRQRLLQRLATLPGVYVPSLYRWHPATEEQAAHWQHLAGAPAGPVHRVWVDHLDPKDQPALPIVPFAEIVQDRLGTEIMRGCTQGCRFCQAGYWYRPVREFDPDVILGRLQRQAEETGLAEVGLLSLSTSDYSQIQPLLHHLTAALAPGRVSVSLPSLRADAFSVELAEAVSRVRKSGFTFAPECGTDRLRRVINKSFTNVDMINAAAAAFTKGWNRIKLYAMIGLPTETDEDLEGLANLARELAAVGRRSRGRRVEVRVSVGSFVPKAGTPFQWQPFVAVDEQRRRMAVLRERFRGMRGVRLTWGDPEQAAIEALLARGDRRLSRTIERAHQLGAVLDGWSDVADNDAWQRALAETGVDMAHQLGPRELSATLPWDLIDAGVSKDFLRAEARRAGHETITTDCRQHKCYRCGIEKPDPDPEPGSGCSRLAAASLQMPPATVSEGGREQAPPQPGVYRRYRVSFIKTQDSRFLSHRQVMDTLERALRAAAVPVRHTEGFNPHVRLSMAPALGVGQEGLAELFDVDCTAPLRPNHLVNANRFLPTGLSLIEAHDLLPGAPSLGKMTAAACYRIAPWPSTAWPDTPQALPAAISDGVRAWELLATGSLDVELNLRQEEGPTPTVKRLLLALGIAEQDVGSVRVARQALVLRPRRAKAGKP